MKKNIFFIFLLLIFLLPLERIGGFDLAGLNIRVSQIIVLFLFFISTLYFLKEKRFFLKIPPSFVFYLLFLVLALFSLINAQEKIHGIFVWLFLLFMFFVPYIVIVFIDSKEKLKKVLYVFLFSALFFALFGFFQFLGDLIGLPESITGLSARYTKEVLGFPRIQSTFIEPLYYANYLLIPLSISFFFILKKIDKKKNLFFSLTALVFLISLMLTFSKGAIVSLAIMIIAVVFFQVRSIFNRSNFLYLVAIFSIIVLLIFGTLTTLESQPNFDKMYTKAYDIITGASITERQDAYSAAVDAFAQKPLLGIGVGNFGPYFSGYPTLPPSFGWPIVNNQYLEILTETGIIGFIIFLIFILSIFYYSIKAYKKTNDKLLKTTLLALNFAFIGILIQYMTFSTLYIMHIWILIGLILATQQIILNKQKDD